MFGFIVEGEENIVEKGENAGPLLDIIIFFLSSLYFKKFYLRAVKIQDGVLIITTLRKEAFENILGKGENAGNQHFLLFPKCFLTITKQISIF